MGRLFRIFKGWWLRLIGKAEAANPKALLEAEIAEFQKATATYNENLAKQAGMIERLKSQIAADEKALELLKARAQAAYAAKQMDRAGALALQVKDKSRETEENKVQMKAADELYKNLVRQRDVYVKEARRKIDEVKSKISKAEMAEAQAKLTEVASATAFDMSGAGASLDRLDEGLNERISNAQGKVRVAGDAMQSSGLVQTEEEQKALEAQALAEFAAQMGLAPPAVAKSVADPSAHDLGPLDADLTPAAPEKLTES